MEKISFIVNEIMEKKGKEWLSLQPKTEQQLMSLAYYLNHPKVQEDLKKIEDLVELYDLAKATNFLRMEKIARKLDELSVKIGKADSIKKNLTQIQSDINQIEKPKQATIENYGKAIKDLRDRIENLLNSSSGSNLHENTRISINIFLNYLNHPNLQNNTELFDEMLEKYEEVEANNFITMQVFNDLLNKVEIKLGKVITEIKAWKSINEREKELKTEILKIEEEKEKLKEREEKLETERNNLNLEWNKLEAEKEKLKEEQDKFNKERQVFATERTKLTVERAELALERSNFKSEETKENFKTHEEKLESERKELNLEWENLEEVKGKLIEEQEKFIKARQDFATEREKLTQEQSNLESEKEKVEYVKKKLEEMEKKIENEISKIS